MGDDVRHPPQALAVGAALRVGMYETCDSTHGRVLRPGIVRRRQGPGNFAPALRAGRGDDIDRRIFHTLPPNQGRRPAGRDG
jgi:hypothetical protein